MPVYPGAFPDSFFRLNIFSCNILGAPFDFAQDMLPPSKGKDQSYAILAILHPLFSILDPANFSPPLSALHSPLR